MDFSKFSSKITINGDEYQIVKLGGLAGMKMGLMLTKTILPTIGSIVDGMKRQSVYDDEGAFAEAALTLCSEIDKLEVEQMILQLLSGLSKNGQDVPDIDLAFKGQVEVLVSLVAFALRENFSKVFMENPMFRQLSEKASRMVGISEEQ